MSPPITYAEAHDVSPYDLARLWLEQIHQVDASAEEELAELATMSALAGWLNGWRPLQIHRAILAGASPQQVADAYGDALDRVYTDWQTWAHGQRSLNGDASGTPGVDAEQYAHVHTIFMLTLTGGGRQEVP